MNKKYRIGAAAVCLVIAGASFWGGIAYGRSHAPAGGFTRGTFTANGQFGTGGMMGGGRGGITMRGVGSAGMMPTVGKIISSNGTSISVQLSNGSTQLVLLSGSTQVAKSVAGNAADLSQGTNVLVTGQSNSDGSITADMIQIRPSTTTRAY